MDLICKLAEVPGQFPIGTTNVLIVFHPSIGESHSYVQQALFGQEAFGKDPDEVDITSSDALFAKDEWCEVAGCALLQFQCGILKCTRFWANPQAKQPIPKGVINAVKILLA